MRSIQIRERQSYYTRGSGCDEQHPSEKDKGTGNNILSSHNKQTTNRSILERMRAYLWFYVQGFVFLQGGKVIFGKKKHFY